MTGTLLSRSPSRGAGKRAENHDGRAAAPAHAPTPRARTHTPRT